MWRTRPVRPWMCAQFLHRDFYLEDSDGDDDLAEVLCGFQALTSKQRVPVRVGAGVLT